MSNKRKDEPKLPLPFIVWLTGHDEATIKQMYNDWVKNNK